MRPKSYLLAFFTANERAVEVPSHAFRIVDNKTIAHYRARHAPLRPGLQQPKSREIVRKFESVKFFLTRESLREVIVRR